MPVDEVGEPSSRQPVHEQSQEVEFDGEPSVGSLAVDASSNAHHLAGEPFLVFEGSDVLNDRIGECQIE
jgi:hypothetical protein